MRTHYTVLFISSIPEKHDERLTIQVLPTDVNLHGCHFQKQVGGRNLVRLPNPLALDIQIYVSCGTRLGKLSPQGSGRSSCVLLWRWLQQKSAQHPLFSGLWTFCDWEQFHCKWSWTGWWMCDTPLTVMTTRAPAVLKQMISNIPWITQKDPGVPGNTRW